MSVYSVIVVADSLEAATRLRDMGLDLHERAARRRPGTAEIAVPAILDDEAIRRVRAAGYRVELGQDLDQVAAERATDVNSAANRFAPSDRADRGGTAQPEPRSDSAPVRALEALMDLADPDGADSRSAARSALGGYLTPAEVDAGLSALAATYPNIASVIKLPERSWEQRDSRLLRVLAGSRAQRVGVLVTGGVHAREWGGSDICVAFATNLLKAYAALRALKYGGKTFPAAQVKAILERLDLFVFPDVNPDGKTFSQANDPAAGGAQGMWWRKNRNPNPGLGGPKGVDVNRNFDFLWSSGIGTATDPGSFTYRGRQAFSEPEARNVRHILDTYPHIAYFVDVHSYGELILYSWGDDDNQSSNPAQNFLNPAFAAVRGTPGDTAYREFIPSSDQAAVESLARSMNAALSKVRGTSYTVQQAVGLYPTSGTSDDYAFSRHLANPTKGKIYGFTIEFGQEFVPPYAEMRRVMAEVAAALTELCRLAADA